MSRWNTCASLSGLLAATVFALSCGDGVAPERTGPGVPDFSVGGEPLLTATFDAGANGFGYRDDPFRGTAAPAYANGVFSATGAFSGGGLRVLLGGIDDGGVLGMSGGWAATITLSAPEDVTLTLRYQLTQSSEYESDEYSDALVSVDGMLRGVAGTDRLARLTGDGNGGTSQTTGWQQVELVIPGLAAGTHTVVIGVYNNKKTAANETTELLIDDVAITTGTGVSIEQTPGTGDLTIMTATTGENQPVGYTMNVTQPGGTMTTLTFALTESKTFPGVPPGDYQLEITDMPGNCALSSGTNPRTVTVPDGGTASTTFEITCTASTGTLMIATATTGENQSQGYLLHITGPGGTADRAIGASDAVTFDGVAPGDYSVELSSVPTNCTVSGANPRTVTVPGGGTGSTTFSVTCTASSGDLTVTAATTGSDLDPDGYTVTVSGTAGTASQAVAANGSVTFSGIPAGDYQVSLSGVASNCAVSGANPRAVTVPGGGTGSSTFSLSCTATSGNLTVTAATTGSDLDPDGYLVTVTATAGSASQAVAVNGSVTFSGIPAGDYQVSLSGVAGNCSVSGANPRPVTVSGGATSSTTFSLSCTATSGNLTVAAATTGSSLDPDGYTVTVNGGNARTISINGSTTYTAVPPGSYSVVLSGVASNCTVSGVPSPPAAVTAGATATVSYSVSCTTPPGDLKVTTSSSGSSIPSSYSVKVDGSLSKTIASTGSVTFTGLAATSHTVVLTVPSNCTVGGGATRTVSVPSGGTAAVSYSVSCITPNHAPSVNAGSDETVLLGVLYQLNASFSDPDCGPWNGTIYWGDGSSTSGTKTSAGPISATHNYLLPGSYTIRVTVTDSCGASGSDTKVLTVLTNLGGIL